jgi:hypothetical protein
MEGLNIFNSSAVLASQETSTDVNFERIEAIIASISTTDRKTASPAAIGSSCAFGRG